MTFTSTAIIINRLTERGTAWTGTDAIHPRRAGGGGGSGSGGRLTEMQGRLDDITISSV